MVNVLVIEGVWSIFGNKVCLVNALVIDCVLLIV